MRAPLRFDRPPHVVGLDTDMRSLQIFSTVSANIRYGIRNYLGGESSSPVAERLNKGSMAAVSPTALCV
eukprot:2891297-Pyramimonas_sp.AAC.1